MTSIWITGTMSLVGGVHLFLGIGSVIDYNVISEASKDNLTCLFLNFLEMLRLIHPKEVIKLTDFNHL